MRYEKAYTLIELIVTVALSSLIVTALISTFLLIQKTIALQQAYADLQESGRFACYYLYRQLKHAGIVRGYQHEGHDIIVVGREKTSYFVARTSYHDQYNERVFALYMKRMGDKQRKVLVDHVSRISVLYGRQCSNKLAVCHYLTAGQVENWQKIISVKIVLFLTSGNKVLGRHLHQNWGLYVSLSPV